MNYKIPKNVYEILNTLNEGGYEAYAVGGCVRDAILGQEPHDWDITTNATPEEVKALFNKTIDTGIQHGTVTAMIGKEGYEITTYRIDGEYKDNRRPSNVEFTSDLVEDLKRRDLTFNAMVMDKDGNVIDHFGGVSDLENKIIRAVGDPNKRFKEDALRMMRAIRFAAKFGFELEDSLYKAIKDNASLIQNISYERIESEISKILTSNHPEKFLELYNTGITKYIMPEFDRMMDTKQDTIWHCYSVGMHAMKSVENIENDKLLRWTMLLHDIGKPDAGIPHEFKHFYDHNTIGLPIAKDILERMKFSTKDKEKVLSLVFLHDVHYKKMNKIRRLVASNGIELARDLIKVQLADIAAQSDYKKEEKTKQVEDLASSIETVYADKTAITLKDLKINGNDLMSIGFKGKEIGEFLNILYERCLSDPTFNNKDRLMKSAMSEYNKKRNLDEIINDKKCEIFNNKTKDEKNIDDINR